MIRNNLKARLTPTDMLGDSRMAARPASWPISARCSALKPVVPMTARPPTAARIRRCSRLASGTENSIRTRPPVSAALASSLRGTPRWPAPATSPASRPSAGCPGDSRAATSRSWGSSRRQATTRLPIRPAAPATTTSAIERALLHQPVLPEDRAQALAVGVGHTAHRQPELRRDHPGHRHGLFDGDRIGLDEHGPRERVELPVELARALPVAVERGVGQLGGLLGHDVGDYRDDAAPADGHHRQRQVVVAGQDRELGTAGEDHLRYLVEGPRRFLDADDVLT